MIIFSEKIKIGLEEILKSTEIKKKEQLRQELGSIYDCADSVIYVKEQKEIPWLNETKELTGQLWDQIEKIIDSHGETAAKIITTSLLTVFKRTLKKSLPKKSYQCAINEFTKNLTNGLLED